jgi:signal transduction histidine kinase
MTFADCLSVKLINLFSQQLTLNHPESSELVGSNLIHLETKSQQEWHSAIASIEKILTSQLKSSQAKNQSVEGLVISSPVPIISNPDLIKSLEMVVFSQPYHQKMALMPSKTSSSSATKKVESSQNNGIHDTFSALIEVPLDRSDNLREEQFCLVFTAQFCCLIVKGSDQLGKPKFDFSFEPEIINQAWLSLRKRLANYQQPKLTYLEQLVEKFAPINPDYKIVSQFTRYLLDYLKINELNQHNNYNLRLNQEINYSVESSKIPRKSKNISLQKTPLPPYPEVELLQALTHEIRTPLTTIKTITKLLLKKAKLSPDLSQYLELIEQECTEQINRMELIFRATELETVSQQNNKKVQLVPISLEQILNTTIPRWQKQAQRRNIILDIIVPHKLPQIVSDPAILTQILTGLMEKFTRNLPTGGHFKVLILPAGNQLKLQFLSESNLNNQQTKCLGKLLLFQPDTGSLCLSTDVAKNIFQALGGKLVIKQKPDKGEILTVFLPLGNSNGKSFSCAK